MPRRRLRPTYVRRNYAFHALIVGRVPDSVWHTARSMQTLWNGLVERHDAVIAPWDADTSRETKRAAYEAFWQDAYLYARDEGERLGLSAWPKWHIYDSFQAAQKRWARRLGGLPHRHYGLQRILIPHRTDSGGVPVSWLFREGERKHTILRPPTDGHHYHTGYMTIGGEQVPVRVLLHRALPDDAVLKRVALCGVFEPAFRRSPRGPWTWAFQCSIEMPAPTPLPSCQRVAGIDLGWRVREDGLRVAVVTDGHRYWEWVLPFDLANMRLRRRQRLYRSHHATLERTSDFRVIWELQSAMDNALDACKALIGGLDHTAWPEDARQLWSGHVRMRAGGLRRLLRLLRAASCSCAPLEAWEVAHEQMGRRLRGSQQSILRSRDHLYRHLAQWLVTHFDAISWEGDLSLKTMAEDAPAGPALDASRKYRQMAGLSRLRQCLQEACAKAGRVLHDTPAAYTTQTCAQCGEMIAPGAARVLSCAGGHRMDQDANAALNLWQAIPDRHDAIHSIPVTCQDGQLRGAVREITQRCSHE